MTTFYPFTRSIVKAPSFLTTFDSNQYTITVIWNISSRRYFIRCDDSNSNLIFFIPLVGTELNINLSSLEWDENDSWIIATTENEHGFTVGQIIYINIINAIPTTYNNSSSALILNETQFAYPYPQDPGLNTFAGSVGFFINLLQGYFFQSTMVFRNQMFEVTP